MKIESILNKITHNWFEKCICLVSAIILFLIGFAERLDKRNFNVPLVAIEDGNLQRSTGLPSNVLVTIRSKSQNINNISSSDIQATIDFSYYNEEGTYAVPIHLSLSKDIILNDPVELTVSPDCYSVKLEKKSRKSVPINVPIVGDPLHGYELSDNKINPQVAILEGPRSMLENINEINSTELVISDRKDDFTEKLSLINLNKFVSIVSPKFVEASVYFQTSLVNKTFSNCSVFFANLDPKLEVASSDSISFTISGAELVVEKFTPSEYSIQADCSQITKAGEYELPIVIAIQDAFKIEKQSQTSVKVIVQEKNNEKNLVQSNTEKKSDKAEKEE